MDEDILVLIDENGMEVNFELLDVLEYEGEEYVVLIPEDAGEDDPVHILHVMSEDMDDGERQYEGIEDAHLIDKLYQMFCKQNGI